MMLSSHQPAFLGKGNEMPFGHVREHSEATQQYIDETIAKTIRESFERAVTTLKEKEKLLQKIARKLLETEVIEGAEFQAMIRETTT